MLAELADGAYHENRRLRPPDDGGPAGGVLSDPARRLGAIMNHEEQGNETMVTSIRDFARGEPARAAHRGRRARPGGGGPRLRRAVVHRPPARHEGRVHRDEPLGARDRAHRDRRRGDPISRPATPRWTANATVALDEISGGRALLGLGAGWVALHSIGLEPARLGEIRRGIEEFRQLFSGEEAELYGTRVRLATAHPPGARLPRGLPARNAAALRRGLRRCGGDGGGRPRLLPLAARLHLRRPRAEAAGSGATSPSISSSR